MSGVDMADQLLAPYCISRKRLKNYYKTLFIVCRKGMTMTRILLVPDDVRLKNLRSSVNSAL